METRICAECGVEKPEDEDHFYVKIRKAGRRSQFWPRCRPCHNRWKWRKQGRMYNKRKNVLKLVRAREALKKAVKRGKIKKPTTCQRCLKTFEKRKLQGHHHNGYSDPLDVIWLCQQCHEAAHKRIDSRTG